VLIRNRAAELPAYVAVRRAHIGYSEYSRYCEYSHEIPEYRKSMLSALPAENLKRTRHGLPPAREATHPRPGRVLTLHGIPIDIPRGGMAQYSEYPHAPAAYRQLRRRPGRCR
jgi:hypothetical protein